MTALDQAFIKAYGENSRSGASFERRSVPTSIPPVRPALGPANDDDMLVMATLVHEPVRATAGTKLAPAAKTTASTAPLSSFATPAKPLDAFRALLEVDHFVWPEACTTLLTQAHEQWHAFGDRLAELMSRTKNCFAFTACQPGEGRTTVTLATAKLLAGRGLRSVVIDADFAHPDVAQACGISAHTGWDDVLDGELPLGEALITAIEDRVTIMPWRGPAMKMARLLESPRLATNLAALRERYDCVLFDCGPLASAAAVGEFASLSEAVPFDAVFLVKDTRNTNAGTLRDVCAKMRRAGVPLQGVVNNFAAASLPGIKTDPGQSTVPLRHFAPSRT